MFSTSITVAASDYRVYQDVPTDRVSCQAIEQSIDLLLVIVWSGLDPRRTDSNQTL